MNDMKLIRFIIIGLAFFPIITHGLQSTSDILIVEAGDNTQLAGAIQRNQEIRIETGGTLTVITDDGTSAHDGSINLIAPNVNIYGKINALAAGHSDSGIGGDPSGSNGGGGAGYGGAGGKGDGVNGGAGGNIYNVPDIEKVGSYGYLDGAWVTNSGYGGGSVRIDAINLTLSANALIDARGNTTAYPAVGGGSGGCVYLNGINTLLISGSELDVSGGLGGPSSISPLPPLGPAGGGGGGRIKIVLHPGYDVANATLTNAPGSGGGGTAQPGDFGINRLFNAPNPNGPTLLLPTDGEVVGRSPTFTFSATDPTNSKFLKYQLIMSLDSGYTSLTYTASQLNPDSGWGGTTYYASGEIATYTLPNELVGGTTYYWSVSVTSNNGVTWVDSGSRSLTALTNQAPTIPVIIQPIDNETQVSALPTFQVLSSDFEGDDLIFRITLSRDPGLTNPQTFDETYLPGWDQSVYTPGGSYVGVTATCQLLSADALVPNTDYYWKVECLDQPYGQSTESAVYHFTTTRVLPNAPNLQLPADQYKVPNSQVTFQFQVESSLGNTLSGQVELSEDNFESALNPPFIQQDDQNGWSQPYYESGATATFTLPSSITLEKNKTYYWRATAFDGLYAGPVSTIRRFSLANQFEFQMNRVLPNPATSVETIQFFIRLSIDAKLTIRIFNKLGKQIDQLYYSAIGGVAGNYINYNIGDYATGVYFYTIEAESGSGKFKQTKKFAVIN